MVSKYLQSIYDGDFHFDRENPYNSLSYFNELAKEKFEYPLSGKKWMRKIYDSMLEYREKFVLNEEYENKNSSLNKAREVLEAADNLKKLYEDVRVWDYYFDTGDSYDVIHGLNTAISALNRMLAYGDPLKCAEHVKTAGSCNRKRPPKTTENGHLVHSDRGHFSEIIAPAGRFRLYCP